ncbi:MAG: hypothetical protein WA989_06715 [Henriciella sp.]|uniref:hypothetical protein n=1 Tax=Henriciella sp. TaxID=1968823 RepID=UPI003C716998
MMVSRTLFVSAALLFTPAVFAQTLNSAAERTAACLEIADAAERLACFEDAATALSDALEEVPAQDGSVAPEKSSPVASIEKEPDLPAWADAPEPEAEPAPPVQTAATAAPDAEEEAEERTPIWARIIPRSKKDDKTVDEIQLTVTRILKNGAGRHFFIMENGQEWEQTFPGALTPPKSLPVAVTIEERMFGSPGLTFDDGTTGLYKVRRVK